MQRGSQHASSRRDRLGPRGTAVDNLRFGMPCGRLGSYVVLVGESAEDLFEVDPVLGEVDRLGRVGRCLSWGQLAEGAMRPGRVVVGQVLGQHPVQVLLVDDQQPTGEFPAQGADDPFADRVRSGSLRRLPFESTADPAARPSMPRLLFLDQQVRDSYPDWQTEARLYVAYLRLISGKYPDDIRLAELVGELCMKDADFAAMWASGRVGECTSGTKRLRHSLVGDVTVNFLIWLQADSPDHRLEVYSPADQASADALALLAVIINEERAKAHAITAPNRAGPMRPGDGNQDLLAEPVAATRQEHGPQPGGR